MFNSGSIRAPIDERNRNGNSSSALNASDERVLLLVTMG